MTVHYSLVMIFHFRLMRRSVYDEVGGIDETFERAQDTVKDKWM